MQQVFFYLFAALTLLCATLVIFNPFTRNPVTSAMFLFLTIVSMAGLFVLLHLCRRGHGPFRVCYYAAEFEGRGTPPA
jgi:hypothetical protein